MASDVCMVSQEGLWALKSPMIYEFERVLLWFGRNWKFGEVVVVVGRWDV